MAEEIKNQEEDTPTEAPAEGTPFEDDPRPEEPEEVEV